MNTPQRFRAPLILTAFCLVVLTMAARAQAQCDLKAVSAYTCDANGNAYSPQVGDTYYLRINWTITGTPKSAYSIKFTMANQTWTWSGIQPGSGSYWGYVGWALPLDGAIPYTITLDPDNVTGDTNRSNNTLSGSFTPQPPGTAIEYYDPVELKGSQTFTVTWTPNSGTVDHGFVLLGVPTSDSFQQVIGAPGPTGASRVNAGPAIQPVWEVPYGSFTPTATNDTWSVTQNFTVEVSNVRVNPTLLRAVTWQQLAAVSKSMYCWLRSDTLVQAGDPTIAAFVKNALPANYRSAMTPYDAARALFLATVKHTQYQYPPNHNDSAVSTLAAGEADCLGFSTLLAACMRHIGIPARTMCGWWKGQSQWHCIMEFYLPGCGWVQADGSSDRCWWDPTGTYAYMFGSDPSLNQYCEVSRGTDHTIANLAVTELQVGWFFYWGYAGYSNLSNVSSLNP